MCLLASIVAATALLVELVVVLVSIVARSVFGDGLLWTDEASRIALSTISFIGGAAAYRGAHHTTIRLVTDRLARRLREATAIGIEWLVLIVTAVSVWQSVGLLAAGWTI